MCKNVCVYAHIFKNTLRVAEHITANSFSAFLLMKIIMWYIPNLVPSFLMTLYIGSVVDQRKCRTA